MCTVSAKCVQPGWRNVQRPPHSALDSCSTSCNPTGAETPPANASALSTALPVGRTAGSSCSRVLERLAKRRILCSSPAPSESLGGLGRESSGKTLRAKEQQ
jgi:hypothetical protein